MASKSKFRHEDIGTIPAGYKVRTVIHPSGHRVRIAFPPGPRRKGTGQIVSVLHPLSGANPCANPCGDKFTHKNMDETITDSKGRKWGVSVLSGGKDWMAEGYPIKGHGIKTRVGRPIVARGASESEAYDKLSEAIDRRNPKKKKIPNKFIIFNLKLIWQYQLMKLKNYVKLQAFQ